MKHSRWLHIACVAGPLSVMLLLIAGVDRGPALLVWLLCPIAMIWMMRRHSGSVRDHDQAPGHLDAPEHAGRARAHLSGAPTDDAQTDDLPSVGWPRPRHDRR